MTPYLTNFAMLTLFTLAAFKTTKYEKMKVASGDLSIKVLAHIQYRSASRFFRGPSLVHTSILKKYLSSAVPKPGVVLIDKCFYFFAQFQ